MLNFEIGPIPAEPKPHQEAVLPKLKSGKVLLGGTGAGKSMTALLYYYRYLRPMRVVVITTAKKRDSCEWSLDALRVGLQRQEWDPRNGQLEVDSWNNIKKYEDVKNAFFIFDEQRLVGTGSWVKSFLKIAKNNKWLLLTATPGDKWEDYAAIFVANGYYKNLTDYKEQHMVYSYYGGYPQLKRYLHEDRLLKLRDEVLVEMEYAPHARRFVEYVEVDHDPTLIDIAMKHRVSPFDSEPFQNAAQMMYTLREIVNSHPSRREKAYELQQKHKRVIIFYNFNYELYDLREVFPDAKEWNGFRHDPVPDDEHGEWVYLVQYNAGAEGWNCITCNTIIFYSMTYSYKTFMQAQGRIDRMNTPYLKLWYYVLMSPGFVDGAISRSLREKKNFNEKKYMEGIWDEKP